MSSDSLKIKFIKRLLEVAQYVLQDKRSPEEASEKLQEIIDEKDSAKFEKDALKLQSDAVSRRSDILNIIKTATARGLVEWKPTVLTDSGIGMRCEINNDVSCRITVARLTDEGGYKSYAVKELEVYSIGAHDSIALSYEDSKFFTSVFQMAWAKMENDKIQAIQSGLSSLPQA